MVDSSTEKLFQVPSLHNLAATVSNTGTTSEKMEDNVQVIPMKEELEVRLEEGLLFFVLSKLFK